jgi:uncharacterized membrane protein
MSKMSIAPEKAQPGLRKRSYLEDRRNFMKVVSLGVWLLFALALLWMFGSYGGIGWWIFLAVLALVVGCVSAFFMWFVFKSVYGIDEPKDDARKP